MTGWHPERWVTDNDRVRSRTSHSLEDLRDSLSPIVGEPIEQLLDIGCGYGGLPALVGEYVSAKQVHGLDIDRRVEQEAKSKNVDVVIQDADEQGLPYSDGQFDMVMTLGMMDYLVSFDRLIREINRVSPTGGWVLVTLPNLGSWHNRLALLMGYQPRDVEISAEILPGIARGYAGEEPAGHIHIPTLRAFTELMTYHGFEAARVTGGRPRQRTVARPLFGLDNLLARRPSLARRFFYVGRKVAGSPELKRQVDLPYQSLD
jgi:SAM-dependent methyltransferase